MTHIRRKLKKYEAMVKNEEGAKLYVVAITAAGGWVDEESYKFFDDIVVAVANRSGASVSAKKSAFFGSIAASLARSFGRALQDVLHVERAVDSRDD